ncbi:MAG: BON domain-containing protein [Pirellulaceae bacterium]
MSGRRFVGSGGGSHRLAGSSGTAVLTTGGMGIFLSRQRSLGGTAGGSGDSPMTRIGLIGLVTAVLFGVATVQAQTGGTGGTGGGTTGGTTGSTTGGTTGGSTGGSQTGGTFSGSGGGSTGTDLGILGTAEVNIREGFLEPTGKLGSGFLTPSNAANVRVGSSSRSGTVGAAGRATASSRTTAARGATGARSGLSGLGSQFGGTGLGSRAGGGTTSPLRVPIRLNAVQATALIPTTATTTRFNQRIQTLPGIGGTTTVSLSTEGRTAVLRGRVATPQQRDLLGRLAMLEPGVASVRNELVVAPGQSGPESIPVPR